MPEMTLGPITWQDKATPTDVKPISRLNLHRMPNGGWLVASPEDHVVPTSLAAFTCTEHLLDWLRQTL